MGTGCLVGPRLLLTASHCVQWNPNGTSGWLRFRPAYYDGFAPFGEAWATKIVAWRHVNGSVGLNDLDTAFDYAVCVLNIPLGNTLGFVGYRTYNSAWNGGAYWQHMGYPLDLSFCERPSFQGGCKIASVGLQSLLGQTGYVLGHFNDTFLGHSGGPVWGWFGESFPRVVGVYSAEAPVPAMNTLGDNEFGGGPALSSLISYQLTQVPS
jgi:V8-like Glu-specific endopeptidase